MPAKKAKKSVRKATGAKKSGAKKSSAKKSGAKKSAAKKSSAKKSSAKKSSAKKSSAKKSSAKKSGAKKSVAPKAPPPPQRAATSGAKAAASTASLPRTPAAASSAAAAFRGPNLQHHAVSVAQMAAVATEGLRSDGEILHVDAGTVAPCRLVDHGGSRFSLCLDDYAMPMMPLFEQLGLQGGGYTWEAVVRSLVKLRHPDLASQLSYDSEAGMFVALGPRQALVTVARLLQAAIADPLVLRTAVERADPDTLE